MKKINKFLKYASLIMGLLCAFLLVSGIVSWHDMSIFIFGPGGVTMAMAAGAAQVSDDIPADTEEAKVKAPHLLLPSVSKKITEMKPSATPLDTIIRSIGLTVPINAWETRWYSSDVRGTEDSVNGATLETGVNTPLSLVVHNIHIWSIDDNALVVGVNADDGKDLVLHVIDKVAATNTLTVIGVNVAYSGVNIAHAGKIPALPNNTVLIRLGPAKSELDAQTSSYNTWPDISWNYCQIFMAQVEESVYEKLHNKEINWDIEDFKAQSIYDMRRSMEFTGLFGARAKIFDSNDSDYKYMMGGLTRYIDKVIEYDPAADLTNQIFDTWGGTIFDGNAGSETRVVFAGKDFLNNLAAVPTVSKQIEAKQSEVVYGVRFNKVETNYGVLYLKHHTLLNVAGYHDKAIVLDINNIEKHSWLPLSTRQLDLQTSGIRKTNAYVIEETFSLALRYPDTHAIIQPTAP